MPEDDATSLQKRNCAGGGVLLTVRVLHTHVGVEHEHA